MKMGHGQLGGSRRRRLSRRASIAFALVVVVAVIVGGAVPAFAAPPDAPSLTGFIAVDSAIVVQFDPPLSDGGSTILSYTATCVPLEGGTPSSHTGFLPNITVPGLTNGSKYACDVVATNSDGDSPPSAFSDIAIPNGKPDAPVAPSVNAIDSAILVTLTPPFDGGTAITGYSATCTSSNGGAPGSGTAPPSPDPTIVILVGQLTNGKDYTCTAAATNINGFGPDSPPSASATPNTVPTTPVAPTVTSPLTGGISVAFTPPFDGGSPILWYVVVCASSDGGATGTEPHGLGSPILITGVDVGKTYTCTLLAHNANGDSGTSPASSPPVVPGAKPGVPAPPTVVAGNASIRVSFASPTDGGSAITGYTADCKSSNGGIERAIGGLGVLTSPIVVTALTNGRSYACTITAANAFGTGPTSPPSSPPIVPWSLPARPGTPTVVAGNTKITVGFHTPYNGGFPITKYRVYCGSPNGGVARAVVLTGLTAVVTGVTNGKSYRCNVTAYTIKGASPTSAPSATVVPHSHGFRMFTGDGGVFVFGDASYYGSAHSPTLVIAMMTTPDNHGYWLVTQIGAVYAFGNARSYGSLAGHHLNRPIVGAAATRTGRGYWLVASDGGIFAFGDAHFYGSTGNIRLRQQIVGMTPTASGRGYWFVAQDGGLFAFGDAHFYGSAAGKRQPCSAFSLGTCIVGMATSAGGTGYWIAAADGMVFGFGTAAPLARGPIPGLTYPMMGIAATESGSGYWIAAANGVVSVRGDAPFIPWPHAIRLARIIRGISR